MLKEAYELGAQQALADAGLIKEAAGPGLLQRLGRLRELGTAIRTHALTPQVLGGAGLGGIGGALTGAATADEDEDESVLLRGLAGAGLGALTGGLVGGLTPRALRRIRQFRDSRRLAKRLDAALQRSLATPKEPNLPGSDLLADVPPGIRV